MALNTKVIIDYLNKLGPGLTQAEGQLDAFAAKAANVGRVMSIAGAAITGSMTASIHSAATYGDEIQKAADRTGVSTEALSELRYAAEQSGVGFGALQMAMFRQARAAYEASLGTEQYKEAFDALGVSVTDSNGKLKGSRELFGDLAGALSKVTNEQQRTALAQEIFGRSGAQLLPLLKQSKEGIEALSEEARQNGIVWSRDAADGAAAYIDSLNRVKRSAQGVGQTLLTALGPSIVNAANAMAETIGAISRWGQEHETAAKIIAVAAGVVGVALGVGGPILMALPFLVGGLRTIQGWFTSTGVTATEAATVTEQAGARMQIAGQRAQTAARGMAAAAIGIMAALEAKQIAGEYKDLKKLRFGSPEEAQRAGREIAELRAEQAVGRVTGLQYFGLGEETVQERLARKGITPLMKEQAQPLDLSPFGMEARQRSGRYITQGEAQYIGQYGYQAWQQQAPQHLTVDLKNGIGWFDDQATARDRRVDLIAP